MVIDLGKIIPKIRGEYNGATTYDTLDIVFYLGSSYISKQDGTSNKLPTNTTYWQMLAAKGDTITQLTPQQLAEVVQQVMNEGVVVDSGYREFKSNTVNTLQNMSEPGNGTIQFQRNGVNITGGSFTTNQSTNKNINIQVPTKMSEMSDYSDFMSRVANGGIEIRKSGDENYNIFDKVESGMIYLFDTAINSLRIDNLMGITDITSVIPARIIFDVSEPFQPQFPGEYYINDLADFVSDSSTCLQEFRYEFEILGNMITIKKYAKISG